MTFKCSQNVAISQTMAGILTPVEVWNGHCTVHGDGVSFFKVMLDLDGVVITCSICAYQTAIRDLREAEAREAEALDEAQLAIQACKKAKGESKGDSKCESKGEGKHEGYEAKGEGKGRSKGNDPWPYETKGEGKGRSKGIHPWPYEAKEDS